MSQPVRKFPASESMVSAYRRRRPAPVPALRESGHGQNRLTAAEGESRDRELRRHARRQPGAVSKRLDGISVDLHARTAGSGTELARMDAHEDPGPGRPVEPDDDLLPVPGLDQALEGAALCSFREANTTNPSMELAKAERRAARPARVAPEVHSHETETPAGRHDDA